MFGMLRLDEYLAEVGEDMPLMVAALLDNMDWSEFESKYAWEGRAPYAPRLMVGIILFGVLNHCDSLRGLEALAGRDLGCMWVAGGIRPDHSVLGRFLQLHKETLTEGFFENVASEILHKTGTTAKEMAIDGTMVQAAASRYRTVKREALDRKLDECRNREPDDAGAAQRKQRYEAADTALTAREQARRNQRKPVDSLRVSTTEPEAAVQPLKNKSFAPSYKASALANKERIVTAIEVDPTSESKVVGRMLDQSKRVAGHPVDEVLADGAYCNETVIDATTERDVNLLSPETSNGAAPPKFSKQNFKYNAEQDTYTCPAGKELPRVSRRANGDTVYRGTQCQECPFRGQCIRGKKTKNRTVKRYHVDKKKDVLREAMADPRAQDRYRKRKAIIEPVFSSTAHLGLRRFRRRGLSNARMEFALYAIAHNITRLYALLGGAAAYRAFLCVLLWIFESATGGRVEPVRTSRCLTNLSLCERHQRLV